MNEYNHKDIEKNFHLAYDAYKKRDVQSAQKTLDSLNNLLKQHGYPDTSDGYNKEWWSKNDSKYDLIGVLDFAQNVYDHLVENLYTPEDIEEWYQHEITCAEN